MKQKYRVFSKDLGWSTIMFIFDEKTNFKEIKHNPGTHMISQEDYVGAYEFDKKYLNLFDKKLINDSFYYYNFSYRKDEITTEKKQWIKISEFVPETKSKIKEYINKPDSNLNESLF